MKSKWFKTLVLACSLVFAATVSFGATWVTANGSTVSWDPVTENTDGTPVIGTIEYQLFARTFNGTQELTLTRVSDTSTGIVLPLQGKYYIGIQAVMVIDGEDVSTSEISWSDDPLVCQDGVTFGIKYFKAPGKVKNFYMVAN